MDLLSTCLALQGVFLVWNSYPFSSLDFASAVHWKCYRNLILAKKKKKSLKQESRVVDV